MIIKTCNNHCKNEPNIDCKIDLNLILISLHLILGGGFAVDNVANKPFTQECTDLPTTTATSDTTVPTEPSQSKSIMGSNNFWRK